MCIYVDALKQCWCLYYAEKCNTEVFLDGMKMNKVREDAAGLSDLLSTAIRVPCYLWWYKFIRPLVRKRNSVISKFLL